MNTSGDAAEQIVRLSLEGFEVTARVTGSGAKDMAALLLAIANNKCKLMGNTNLGTMIKSGKDLMVFTIKEENYKRFKEEAKRYGILYNAVDKKGTNLNDGVIDIIVKEQDAPKINRIVERFNFIDYNVTNFRSDVTKIEENKGLEGKIEVNPHLAKTEKSPQSKPFSEMKKSDQGTKLTNKESVLKKLDNAKKEIKTSKSTNKKSEVKKNPPKKVRKEK